MLLHYSRALRLLTVGALAVLGVKTLLPDSHTRQAPKSGLELGSPEFTVANRTLGFQKILAISSHSTSNTWRLDGLQLAAQYTGIEIDVPHQPARWPKDRIQFYRRSRSYKSGKYLTVGEAQCWLGHVHVLERIVETGLTTALVMEDDVDWDVEIKQQLAKVAPLVRQLTEDDETDPTQPYGMEWDVLWLGHCGDSIPEMSVMSIRDDTLPSTAEYVERDGARSPFPLYRRMVHHSVAPICTFAYGVTAQSAQKMLGLTGSGVTASTSEQIQVWCQKQLLRCVTVNPELFHHRQYAGHAASEIDAVDGWHELSDIAATSLTANIRLSARCQSDSSCLNVQNDIL